MARFFAAVLDFKAILCGLKKQVNRMPCFFLIRLT